MVASRYALFVALLVSWYVRTLSFRLWSATHLRLPRIYRPLSSSSSLNSESMDGMDDLIDTGIVDDENLNHSFNINIYGNFNMFNAHTDASTFPDFESLLYGDACSPPLYIANDSLAQLQWSRHAHVVAQNSLERFERVFLPLTNTSVINHYRIPAANVSFDAILTAFLQIQEDMEAAKLFIRANLQYVPPILFLTALTREKFNAQYANDLQKMEELKEVRKRYILVADQVNFPAYVEYCKAETRMFTYLTQLARLLPVLQQTWDDIEWSMVMVWLLNARLEGDFKVHLAYLDILTKYAEYSREYFTDIERKEYIVETLVKPALSAEFYVNASRLIAQSDSNIYRRIMPELRLLHETYFVNDPIVVRKYIEDSFCPNNNITLEALYERMCGLEVMLQTNLMYEKCHLLFQRTQRLRSIMSFNSTYLIQLLQKNKKYAQSISELWGGDFPLISPDFQWFENHANKRTLFKMYRPKFNETAPIFHAINLFEDISKLGDFGAYLKQVSYRLTKFFQSVFLKRTNEEIEDDLNFIRTDKEGKELPLAKDLPIKEAWLRRDPVYTRQHPRTEAEYYLSYTQAFLKNSRERMQEIKFLQQKKSQQQNNITNNPTLDKDNTSNATEINSATGDNIISKNNQSRSNLEPYKAVELNDDDFQRDILALQLSQAQDYLAYIAPQVRNEAELYGFEDYNISESDVVRAAKEHSIQRRKSQPTIEEKFQYREYLRLKEQLIESKFGKEFLTGEALAKREEMERKLQEKRQRQLARKLRQEAKWKKTNNSALLYYLNNPYVNNFDNNRNEILNISEIQERLRSKNETEEELEQRVEAYIQEYESIREELERVKDTTEMENDIYDDDNYEEEISDEDLRAIEDFEYESENQNPFNVTNNNDALLFFATLKRDLSRLNFSDPLDLQKYHQILYNLEKSAEDALTDEDKRIIATTYQQQPSESGQCKNNPATEW